MQRRFPAALAVCVGVALCASSSLSGQQPERATLQVTTLPEGSHPVVDGKVDDEAWLGAHAYDTFTQQEPNDGEPATERTEIRFLADRTTLYIGVIAFDSEPDRILVSQSRRDADLNDTDSIQILLDTLNDGQNGFIFGTNPFGIEYDGQVMSEGNSGVASSTRMGSAGSQGGQVGGFNVNWDADWVVKAAMTARGWEAEFAIPLRTVRYKPGTNQTWGVNVTRNIRRKNEQVFLAPVPRGYSIQRVSVAAKLGGLTLPVRRQLQLIPFGVASVAQNKTTNSSRIQNSLVDDSEKIGFDAKVGITSSLTLDATVNTDFAQVESDEQQVNLTRFALFFPEKRPFFLENAQTFQLGQQQSIDLFFSRRIGFADGVPVQIIGGARVSGKIDRYNLAFLNMQTKSKLTDQTDPTTGARKVVAPANNFTVARVQREVGRSNFGGIMVNRQAFGTYAASSDYNRAYGADVALQMSRNGKLFAFLARTDSPTAKGGSGSAGRAFYSYANALWSGSAGYSQVGEHFNPEVGYLSRSGGYRAMQLRSMVTYDPDCCDWVRRWSPHMFYNAYWDLDGQLSTSDAHWHAFDIQQSNGGRFGVSWNVNHDNPKKAFTPYKDAAGRTVVIPAGQYSWNQAIFEFQTNQSSTLWMNIRAPIGSYYNSGHYAGFTSNWGARIGAQFAASIGWNRDQVRLPFGNFTNDLLPLKVSYSLTKFASVEGLLQYNSQASTFSSNVRFALLNRSGTGFFIVYNNQQDTAAAERATPKTTDTPPVFGQSVIVKMSRLFDF